MKMAMNTEFALIARMFQTNAKVFEKALAGIPDEKWLACPHDSSNHLNWIAGHVIVMRSLVPRMLGQEWSAPWEKLYARGAKLESPEAYPSAAELRRAWHEVSDKLSATLANVSAESLERPAPQPEFSLDGKVSGAIATLSLHETYHVGQAGYLRKLLGYGQTVG